MFRLQILLIILFINIVFADTKLQKVSLQLNWKYQFEFAGYIAAYEKGFYKDVGLDVKLIQYHYGIDIIDKVLSGKATYGIDSSNIFLAYLQGKHIKLLASIFKKSAMVLVTKPNIL